MPQLVYIPKKDITIYELSLILKVFTYGTLPPELKTSDVLFSIYNDLPLEAKRHFEIK